jgi:hypothetical protein
MSSKTELKKMLESLIAEADEITQLYESSQQKLYLNLGSVYLWWKEANKIKGFLEELYDERKLVSRGGEENFTRLVRLVWQMDWSGKHSSPKLQNWARALRGLHQEFKTNKDAYDVAEPQEKIRQFFDAKGGINGVGSLVSPMQKSDEQEGSVSGTRGEKKKSKQEVISDSAISAKHSELGEVFYAEEAQPITSIFSRSKKIEVTRKGYAVALLRRTKSGSYDILGVTNNDEIIRDTIVQTYKRNDDNAPQVLRLLAEVIETQALPIVLEKHRSFLADTSDVLASDRKTRLKKTKRLVIRAKQKDIILSESRSDCSVVTIAVPSLFPSNIKNDISLRAINQRFIEQSVVQSRDLCFHTTLTQRIEVLDGKDLVASHRLKTKNTVTDKITNLYFYPMSHHKDGNEKQADIDKSAFKAPMWSATVDKDWVDDLNSICVSNWLREYGVQINRDRHKQVMLELSKDFVLKFYGTRGKYTQEEKTIPKPKVSKGSKNLSFHVRSKDIFPVLSALGKHDIQGDVKLNANEDVFTIMFRTQIASYFIVIPTCNELGHLNSAVYKRN